MNFFFHFGDTQKKFRDFFSSIILLGKPFSKKKNQQKLSIYAEIGK